MRNNEVKQDLEAIEYVLKTHGFHAMYKPIQCVKAYIVHLERENFGLKQTIKNKDEKIAKLGGKYR